jgi:alkylation response protein AidB-like acyl-CoA dehydrogenase
VSWCQLFSEPGAGSDLAGLTTRAERDGSRWIINGQKVWSSMAMAADHGMLLARTDFAAPKHKGISWFAFPLDQAGVTIRPLRQMNGEAEFNEVFFDDAVVDDVDLVGGEGNGWTVAQTTLRFERSGIGAGGGKFAFPVPGPKGGMLGMRAGDAARIQPPHRDKAMQFRELLEMAIALGRADDVLIRQKLAQLHTLIRIGDWNALRARADASRGGLSTIANLGKIAQSQIMKLSASLGTDIIGADGMLAAPHGTEGGRLAGAMLFSPAWSIAGGTDEIQRNIIGERALGLPRESSPERDMAYGEFLRTVGPSTR